MKLIIRSQLRTLALEVDASVTVAVLKQALARKFQLHPSLQRLLCLRFGCRVVLSEPWPLSFYGLKDGSVLTLESVAYNEEAMGRKRSSAVAAKASLWQGLHKRLEPEPVLTLSARLIRLCKQNRCEEFENALPADVREARSVLAEGGDNGWQCIHFVCFLGFEQLLQRLLALGVEVNSETRDSWTALMLACYQNHYSCVAQLLQRAELNINQVTARGAALHMAVQRGSGDICSALLRAGADLDTKDARGREAAALPTRPEIAALLSHYKKRVLAPPSTFEGKVQHAVSLLRFKVYLVLNSAEGVLLRFDSEGKYRSGLPPTATVLLADITDVTSASSVFGYRYGFAIVTRSHKSQYYAKTKEEASDWAGRIKAAISASHTRTTVEEPRIDKRVFVTASLAMDFRASVPAELMKGYSAALRQPLKPLADERDTYDSSGYVTFSDFKVIEELGAGAFGRVYKVRRNGQSLALKLLSKVQISRQQQTQYIIQENEILKKLRHPFIVRLFHSLQTPKSLGLVMELCPCGDLAAHISEREAFTEEEVRFYAAELLLAVEYLHSLNFVFRDMKPENVLIDRVGHIRLADFGIAKAVASAHDMTKTFCGSPAYLAPETVLQEGSGQAADIYGLGIVMYEMATGTPPFFSYSADELFDSILHRPVEFPDKLSPDARDLIRSLIDRDPRKRPTATAAKQHPFFESIDWDKLLRKEVPPPTMSACWKEPEDVADSVYPLGAIDKDYSRQPSLEECWADFY